MESDGARAGEETEVSERLVSSLFQFDEATHTYLFGERRERVPSVTQIMNGVGIVDYSHIPADVLKRAAERGTRAHKACEYLLSKDLNWDTVSDEIFGYVTACEKFLADTGFTADEAMIERQGVHELNGMRYGYRLDAEGMLNGKRALIDFKCTASVQKHWGIQLAAYELAASSRLGERCRRVVVHLGRTGAYHLVPCEDLNDYRVFGWALGVETWKQGKGKKYVYSECPDDYAD